MNHYDEFKKLFDEIGIEYETDEDYEEMWLCVTGNNTTLVIVFDRHGKFQYIEGYNKYNR